VPLDLNPDPSKTRVVPPLESTLGIFSIVFPAAQSACESALNFTQPCLTSKSIAPDTTDAEGLLVETLNKIVSAENFHSVKLQEIVDELRTSALDSVMLASDEPKTHT
jgi:hypothetical protein